MTASFAFFIWSGVGLALIIWPGCMTCTIASTVYHASVESLYLGNERLSKLVVAENTGIMIILSFALQNHSLYPWNDTKANNVEQ